LNERFLLCGELIQEHIVVLKDDFYITENYLELIVCNHALVLLIAPERIYKQLRAVDVNT
jgi:hypothetical protein